MLVPFEHLRFGNLKDVKANHLLLNLDRGGTLLWRLEVEGRPLALFLSGKYAGEGFFVNDQTDWTGLAIGPVELRLDPASATTRSAGWPDLHAMGGKLRISVNLGRIDTVRAEIGSMPSPDHDRIYFSSWALGLTFEERGRWTELLTVKGPDLSSPLISGTE